MADRGLKDYEFLLLVWFGGLGFVWTFIALWAAITWQPAPPSFDLSGILRAVLLWPAWLTMLIGWGLYNIGVNTGLALLSGPLLGLLVGLALILQMRRNV
ncbi:MAG: hypothetical protein HY326_04725 [Chloroflexi bacterium]|nr:hypothetical protein [Chloroflexota bacterium]